MNGVIAATLSWGAHLRRGDSQETARAAMA